MAFGRFARGMGYGLEGLRWLRREPALRRYWLPPLLVNVALFVGLQVVALRHHAALAALIWPPAPAGDACATDAWTLACLLELTAGAGRWLVNALSWAIAAAVALLVAFLASILVAAPFNDALSEVVERRRGGQPTPPFSLALLLKDAGRSLWLELCKLALFALLMGPLWLLSWLAPGAGQIAYVVVGGLLSITYLALDFVDWPAARRGWGVRRRVALLRRHLALLWGFGCVVWLLLFVPVLSLLLMPAAVIGGTLLFGDLEAHGELPRENA